MTRVVGQNRTVSIVTATAPAWVTTAIGNGWAVGEWLRISGSSPTSGYGLTATNTLNQAAGGVYGNNATLDSWGGGGWWAPNLGTHGKFGIGPMSYHNSPGHPAVTNDIYVFDLATRQWSQVMEGASSGNGNSFGEYPDGSANTVNIANELHYNADHKSVIWPVGWENFASGSDVGVVPYGHRINIESALATAPAHVPSLHVRLPQTPTPPTGELRKIWAQMQSAYNPNDGKSYFHGADNSLSGAAMFMSYDFVANAWTVHGQPWESSAPFLHAGMAVDTRRNVMVWLAARQAGNVQICNLDSPSTMRQTNYSGVSDRLWNASLTNSPGGGDPGVGWKYSPALDAFIRCGGSSTVYKYSITHGDSTTFPASPSDTNYAMTVSQMQTLGNGVTPNGSAPTNGEYNLVQLASWDSTEVLLYVNEEGGPVNAFLVNV